MKGDDRIDLELVSATELGEGSGRTFCVAFRDPRDALLHQRTRRMEHEQIGAFEIFLVPIGPDEEGLSYEAVFNRASSFRKLAA